MCNKLPPFFYLELESVVSGSLVGANAIVVLFFHYPKIHCYLFRNSTPIRWGPPAREWRSAIHRALIVDVPHFNAWRWILSRLFCGRLRDLR